MSRHRGPTLRLHEQALEVLPQDALVPELVSIQAPGNRLARFPELHHLTSLTDLNLADNDIAEIEPSALSSVSAQLMALTLTGNCLACVPAEMGKLKKLELLSLAGNSLKLLPVQLGECTALRSLTLSENALVELPPTIGQLQCLRTLKLDHNETLTALPEELCKLSCLSALSVAACSLTWLPQGLGGLTLLSTLQAKDNRLTSLPSSIGQLRHLRTLALEGNRLESLPHTLGGCDSLRVLSLSVNRLRALPQSLSGLISLRELRLDDNPLVGLPDALPPALRLLGLSVCSAVTQLPAALGRLAELEVLAAGAARIRELPAAMFEPHAEGLDDISDISDATGSRLVEPPAVPLGACLRTLQLSGNVLELLPDALGNLTSLRTLEVSDNRLGGLPTSIGQLACLETLRASENRIAGLPVSIGNLSALRTLGLGANRLASLPATLGQLTRLEELELHSNRLQSLPTSLGRVVRLRRLLLDDNELHALPDSLARLTRLEELGLAGNLLTELPRPLLGLPGSGDGAGIDGAEPSAASGPTAPCGSSGEESSQSQVCGLKALRRLRLHSNRLVAPPDLSTLTRLLDGSVAALYDNPCYPATSDRPRKPAERPRVALLLPGLLRNYSHGAHWRRFIDALAHAYAVDVFLCLWAIQGSVANNFVQSADKVQGLSIDLEKLAAAYPAAAGVELVDPKVHWIDKDSEGFDGRYVNQWSMVARCWRLMERLGGDARYDYVIRARPDLRVACLPVRLDAQPSPYLAMQERLWGSDCFFYGDYASMRALCEGLAPRYEEYTRRLGQASSEPMMHAHLEELGFAGSTRQEGQGLVRFARCCSVDRT